MISLALSLALVGAGADEQNTGCRFFSRIGQTVVVFADTNRTDAGDYLASFTIPPGGYSEPITPKGDKLRYRYRSQPRAAWTESFSTSCGPNMPVILP